jgi:hypothetical protein
VKVLKQPQYTATLAEITRRQGASIETRISLGLFDSYIVCPSKPEPIASLADRQFGHTVGNMPHSLVDLVSLSCVYLNVFGREI